MMDRQKGRIVFECDTCGEVLDTSTGSFEVAQEARREAEWKVAKIGMDWSHYCPSCGVP